MYNIQLKGQSAIEYLITYGWMLLVISVVGGAVFSVVSDQTVESSSGFGDQWLVENFGYSSEQNSLNLVLQNRASDKSNLTAVRVTDGGKSYYFDTGFTEFSSLGSEAITVPGIERQRGSNTLDIAFSYDSGGFTNMESSGSISGGFSLMDERKFEVSTLEQWNKGNGDGIDLFSLPVTLDYVGSEQMWRTKGIGQGVRDVAVDQSGNIFVAGRDDPTITKFDDSGNKLWESDAEIHPENEIHDIKVDKNGDAYVALGRWPYEESVAKIDGATGDRLWENTNPRYVYGGLSIDNTNEIVYAGERDERVFQIGFNGTEVNRFKTEHDARLLSIAHDASGEVYTGSQDDTLRKYDADGNELWSYTGPEGDILDIVVDDNYVYSVSSDNKVRKNNKDTGDLETSYDAGSSAYTISQSASNIFAGLGSNKMIRMDKNLNNKMDFEQHPSDVHGSAIKNGRVYSASTTLYVRDVDSSNSVHIGEHESRIREVASDSQGNSYSASRDGKVRKYSSNGELAWATDTGDRVRAIEVGEDGELYAGNRDGRAMKFDTTNGDVTLDVDVGDSIWAIDADSTGNIYVGTYSNGIYKYDSSGSSQWNMAVSESVRGIEVLEDHILASADDGTVKKITHDGDIEWEKSPHDNTVWDVAANEDIVYTGSADNTLKGLDIDSGEEQWTLSGPGGTIDDIETDKDGNIYVANGGGTKKFDRFGRVVWEASEGHTALFVGENSVATMSGPDGVVKLDKETGDVIWKHSTHDGGNMWGIATDSSGNIYSAATDDTILKSTPEGIQDWRFEGHSGNVYDVEYDDSEDVLYSISTDNTVRKIDSSGTQLWSTNPGGGSGYTIGLGTDHIYTGHSDGNVYQISKETGDVVNTYQVHDDRVWRLSVDSDYIYSGGRDDAFKKTEISTGNEVISYESPEGRVSAVHDPDSSSAFIGTYDGEVRKIDGSGNTEWTFDDYEEGRVVYDVDTNNDYVLAVSNDGTIRAINKISGEEEWKYQRWRERTAFAVHADDNGDAYLGDTYGNFYKFDSNGELITTSSGLTTQTQGVAMDENGYVYAVGRGTRFTRHNNETGAQEWESDHVKTSIWNSPLDYADGKLYITRSETDSDLGVIDPEDGSLIEKIDTSSSNRAVDVASDGKIMLGISGGTQMLDAEGNEIWKCNNCHERYSYEVKWGPNEQIVYSIGTFDGSVIAQDSETGDIIWEWENPVHNRQEGLEVGDDGLVYAGGNDRIVNVFDGQTGEEEFTIEGHSGTIYSLDTDTLGNVYSVSSDNTIMAASQEGQSLWSRTDARRTLMGVTVNSADDIFFGGLDLGLIALSQEFSEEGSYNSTIFDAGTEMTWPDIETETTSNNHVIDLRAEFSNSSDFSGDIQSVSFTDLDGEQTHDVGVQDMKYGRFILEMALDGGNVGNSPAISKIALNSQLEEGE